MKVGDDTREDLADQFCERVRDAYLDLYGSDGLDTDDPFTIGTCLVLMVADFIDGDTCSIMVRHGRNLEALGLAREAIYYLLPSED